MRIALISDLHGNLLALETALTDIQRQGVDRLICLGDVAALGPQPRQVVRRLQELGCPCIMGNHDEHILRPELLAKEIPWIQDVTLWAIEQLSPDDLDFLRTFQPLLEVPLPGGKKLLCVHGSPRSNEEGIRADTTDEQLEEMLAGQDADVIVAGHTHTPLVRLHNGRLIVNIGSTGYPIRVPWPKGANASLHPWLEYAILTCEEGALNIALQRIHLDMEALTRAASETDLPGLDFWLNSWL